MKLTSAIGLLLASSACAAPLFSPKVHNEQCPNVPKDVTLVGAGKLMGLEFVCETSAEHGYEKPPGDPVVSSSQRLGL